MSVSFGAYARGLTGHHKNTCQSKTLSLGKPYFDTEGVRAAQASISRWPEYRPTKEHAMQNLADLLGVSEVIIKDESTRFGLGTFKALGGGYAINYLVQTGALKSGDTVTCATDGNHGRGVAWAASKFGLGSVVYIPGHVSKNRQSYIEKLGAKVIRVEGSYEDALSLCTRETDENGWKLISDTATERDVFVPRLIMNSYTTIAREIFETLDSPPTHVFVPVGVGGLASAITEECIRTYQHNYPQVITVEPAAAAGLYESFRAGVRCSASGNLQTFMGCLACGMPATIPWTVLSSFASGGLAISDDIARRTLIDLADGAFGDGRIEGGESGVSAVAGMLSLASAKKPRTLFGINDKSRIVALLTEGPTDSAIFKQTTGRLPVLSYG